MEICPGEVTADRVQSARSLLIRSLFQIFCSLSSLILSFYLRSDLIKSQIAQSPYSTNILVCSSYKYYTTPAFVHYNNPVSAPAKYNMAFPYKKIIILGATSGKWRFLLQKPVLSSLESKLIRYSNS